MSISEADQPIDTDASRPGGKWRDFGIRIGGGDPELIGSSYERAVFTSRGLLLMLIPAFAALFMFLALRTYFGADNWKPLIPAALMWYMFIFLLDRWIISTIDIPGLAASPETSTTLVHRFMAALRPRVGWFLRVVARLAMAGVIAFLISEPLLYVVFEPSITKYIDDQKATEKEDAKVRLENEMSAELDGLREAKDSAALAAQNAAAYATEREIIAKCEVNPTQDFCEGVTRTGDPGYGPDYDKAFDAQVTAQNAAVEAQQKATEAQAAYDQAAVTHAADVQLALDQESARIDARRPDPGIQHEALTNVKGIGWQVWLWRGGALMLELTPLLMKLVLPANVHDQRVRERAIRSVRGSIDAAQIESDDRIKAARAAIEHAHAMRKIEHDGKVERAKTTATFQNNTLAADNDNQAAIRDFERSVARERARLAADDELSKLKVKFSGANHYENQAHGESYETETPAPTTPLVEQPDLETSAPEQADRHGEVVGKRWRLVKPLQTGSSSASQTGSLYTVRDIKAGSPWHDICVIKRLMSAKDWSTKPPELAAQIASIEAQRESLPCGQTISPYVATIIDTGFDKRHGFYQVTPHFPTSLATYLSKTRDEFTLKNALDITEQVLRGLKAAWTLSSPILHLDIKPSNIMVHEQIDEEPIMKIIDFGQAMAPGEPYPPGGFGTRGYSPREQLDPDDRQATGRARPDPHKASFSSDLYSVGCLLYYMLTGQRPWDRELLEAGLLNNGQPYADAADFDAQVVRVMHKLRNPRGVDTWLSTIPPEVVGLVSEWMAPNPSKRGDGADGESYANNALARLNAVQDAVWRSKLNLQEVHVGVGALAQQDYHRRDAAVHGDPANAWDLREAATIPGDSDPQPNEQVLTDDPSSLAGEDTVEAKSVSIENPEEEL